MSITEQIPSLELLQTMLKIREVELEIARKYPDGDMRCPTHLSIGQEAAAAGVCAALKKDDLAVSTHRAHAHYLAKGGSVRAMIAEIYGKATGCSRGKGGSMHLTDWSVGFVGSTAIVGNSIPVGVGLGFSLKMKGVENISVVFLGDGSVEEGVFYESINFAVVKKLPVLFVCENNLYSVYSPLSVRQPKDRRIYSMVEAMGITTETVDGNDVAQTYRAALDSVTRIRLDQKPHLMELSTYRLLEHCGPNFDNELGYRSKEEFEFWKNKDPIKNFETDLIAKGVISEFDLIKLRGVIKEEVKDAFEYAERSPYPDENEAFANLYSA
ncbi:MAG: thiamine pyrophosphate-dependent dehydrogenase E1 component subunit alpha [Polynucleobacter sp.]|nr:thiamine pyrophosphate-dependent dehydrogenase E1 component subunit alpha [Polynucleobacter sp.]